MSKLIKILSILVIVCSTASAQDGRRNAQSGEIVLEKDSVKLYTQEDQQRDTVEFVRNLSTYLEALSTGGSSQMTGLKKEQLEYLGALYLYCTINNGTCPEVLDTVLETDVINARLTKEIKCPNTKAFWKIWINSDMEKRQNYSMRTGFLNDAEEFKRSVRPKYIKCEDTIKSEVGATESDSAFFKSRYNGEKSKRQSIDKVLKQLEEIQAKKLNLFSSVGVR